MPHSQRKPYHNIVCDWGLSENGFSILAIWNCHLIGNWEDQSNVVSAMENIRHNVQYQETYIEMQNFTKVKILFVDVLLVTLILSAMTTRICYHCEGIFDIWFLSWTKIKKRFYSITHIQVPAIITQSLFIDDAVRYLQ